MNGMIEPRPRRIYFDANVYITALESRSDAARAIFRLFGGWDWQQHVIVTSEFTLAEVLVHPIASALRSGDYELHDSYQSIIADEPGVREVLPASHSVLVRTALVRAQMHRLSNRKIRTPDAIHVASALEAECDTFVSGDADLLAAVKDLCNRVGLEHAERQPSLRHAFGVSQHELDQLAEALNCP
jgi:predicted nucleic acid-binding protein